MAEKTNANESAIDKTAFFAASLCGVCHPGGGGGEFDRDGYPYYNADTGQFGYELAGRDPTYDGDYTVLDATGAVLNPAPWNITGVSEPDCLSCHRSDRTVSGPMNMNWIWRAATLRGGPALVDGVGTTVPALTAAPTAGQGWFSSMEMAEVPPGMPPQATSVQIDYTVGLTSGSLVEDPGGTLRLSPQAISRVPKDYACWGCHAMADQKKRGQVWFDADADVHYAGLNNLTDQDPLNDVPPEVSRVCSHCHPGDVSHMPAKGNAFASTVHDDLDYAGFRTCRDCHLAEIAPGVPNPLKDPDAPEPVFPLHIPELVVGDMINVLSCQACHIPYAAASSDMVVDHAVSGVTVGYSTEEFLSADPLDPSDPDKSRWYPALEWKEDSDGLQRLFPSKQLLSIWWADWDRNGTPEDMSDDVIAPIPLWKVRQITGGQPLAGVTDDNGDGKMEVNRPAEVDTYIQALKGNDSYGRPVAANPVLVKGGRIWYEDPGQPDNVASLVFEDTGLVVESTHSFSMDHNVLPAAEAWGSEWGGWACNHCHYSAAAPTPVMDRLILVDPFDANGLPVYEEVQDMAGLELPF